MENLAVPLKNQALYPFEPRHKRLVRRPRRRGRSRTPASSNVYLTGRADRRYGWRYAAFGRARAIYGLCRPLIWAQDREQPTSGGPPVADDTSIRPFRVNVPDEDLAELHRRIAATRLPSKELVADRSQGVQLATIQELARYWENEYDWRRCEARLNALPQFTTEIDGLNIHFIHVKSRHENALPLI